MFLSLRAEGDEARYTSNTKAEMVGNQYKGQKKTATINPYTCTCLRRPLIAAAAGV